jgi:hypothetical protein
MASVNLTRPARIAITPDSACGELLLPTVIQGRDRTSTREPTVRIYTKPLGEGDTPAPVRQAASPGTAVTARARPGTCGHCRALGVTP